jgi:SAM-dependent methyltransferase
MDFGTYTILRELEYKRIATLSLEGKILDLGGSTKSGYQELMRGEHQFVTVNLDAGYGCDLVFDIEQRFPLEDGSFDHVICLNVLEHVYEFENVVRESYRVLKMGGSMVLITPFMFPVHGSPQDYLRYTREALKRLLSKTQFYPEEISVLGHQVFSLLFQLLGGSLKPTGFRAFAKTCAVNLDRFLASRSKKYLSLRDRIPLGFFTIARKR